MKEIRVAMPSPAGLRRTARAAAGAVATLLTLTAVHAAGAATLTRGPYLQVGTASEITIRWRTDVATDSRVRFGPSPTELTGTVNDAAPVTIHSVKVSGLQPETRYYYSIGSSTQTLAGGTAAYTFQTAPPTGASRATRVWILGDSGKPGSDQQRVKNAYLNWTATRGTDVWLMLGDNAYDSGTDSEYQAGVFNAYPEVLRSVCLWPTRGNHDDVGSGTDYYDIFTMPTAGQAGGVPSGTEAYYSFDYGNVHFICLDSEGSSRSRTGAMATWLASDLATTQADWIVAYWHHPPYSKGSHDSDDESDMIDMRQNFLPILEAGGVDLVLTGHSHSYERSFLLNGHYGSSGSLQNSMILDHGDGRSGSGGDGAYRKPGSLAPNVGAVYAVCGSSAKISGGSLDHPAMVVSLNRLGSMVLDIDESSMVVRFMDDAGGVRDDFTILKEATVGVPERGEQKKPKRMPAILTFKAEPNPVSGRGATFEYALASPARVTLTIFSVDGRRVARPLNAESGSGTFEISWNGRDGAGRRVPSGVYFAALESVGEVRVQRLVVLE